MTDPLKEALAWAEGKTMSAKSDYIEVHAMVLASEITRLLSTLEACRAELAAVRADAKTRVEAAENCSGQWLRDRNLAIKQRDKAEAQLSHFTGEKPPIFIHAGDHCPAEAALAEAYKAKAYNEAANTEHINAVYRERDSARAANAENARLATLNGQEVVRLTAEVERRTRSEAGWINIATALRARIDAAIVTALRYESRHDRDPERGTLWGEHKMALMVDPAPSTPTKEK